ncbi:uncharacterized protein LOC127259890 isoform X2 [Andrographis paniculata]|uniref:uncharacterized protein LOC127259890 isoform X2 n=1 Tax=Andrographis paniculata TaxID=175694 RepID=UPI0021E73DD8|nr:uncharacterized protein LOC127259890 isoform X2 [Andrographis paniculata]
MGGDNEGCVENQFFIGLRSESKKRGISDVEETSDCTKERVKTRDLESVFRSEERRGCSVAHSDDSGVLDLNVDSVKKAKGLNLDLNAEDTSSSINDPFDPEYSKCGKESMRVWKGLKQNNYMSTPYRAVPAPVPKPRVRKKSNNDLTTKRKIELAKKEQVDRFARVAAPSGLLNGLNPGIINHVRNSKQVHAIIEALVRSERNENQVFGSKKMNSIEEQGNAHGNNQTSNNPVFSKSVCTSEAVTGGEVAFRRLPTRWSTRYVDDDKLALKLSSSVADASDDTCLSNDGSTDLGSVTSLSVKAANVASQWLELLSQDIQGCLAALRRSKKRVRDVIITELPLLISREFPEKDSCTVKQSNAEAHHVRWRMIFAQMDKALSEEESYLENWLSQVKEMQVHCEKGLYISSLHNSTAPIRSTDDTAVRAAAASIYSTCNFLLSKPR